MKPNFLWGGSISAAQCEGAWNVDGKSPVEIDYATVASNDSMRTISYVTETGVNGIAGNFGLGMPEYAKRIEVDGEYYSNRNGIDFYNNYKEDILLFAEMGFKSLNLSISWARIYPCGIEKGINWEGVEFYRSVLLELKKYNIEPICTLFKYDMPVYFEEQLGGWKNKKLIDEFLAFAKVCFEEYKDLVKYWITFNEINVDIILQGVILGIENNISSAFVRVHHQLLASAKAVKMAHQINPEYKIGCMICSMITYPLTPNPKDILAVQKKMQDIFWYCGDVMVRGNYPTYSSRIWKENNVELAISLDDEKVLREGKVDFYAFSYYSSSALTAQKSELSVTGNMSSGIENPYLEKSEWGWTMDPDGLKYALHEIYDRYQIPLLIVENGLGARDTLNDDGTVHDDYRINYLRTHIQKVIEACGEGVDLIGYNSWGCIDLIAASTGQISKRYGYIYVDIDDNGNGTYERYRKDSFYWYKKVIESNGKNLD
ncbi:hypothetical protein A4S06_00380 [Erysipelotrichaceae bacterium MTC7]|nr:hypothetical protein A4S06_00380 [Erysipelotrichaceae bacterium MTC7]